MLFSLSATNKTPDLASLHNPTGKLNRAETPAPSLKPNLLDNEPARMFIRIPGAVTKTFGTVVEFADEEDAEDAADGADKFPKN